jgi:hypothetical protein
MNKYNISPKAYKAYKLIMVCVIAGLCLWAAYGIVKVFSSSSSVPAPAAPVGAERIIVPVLFDDPNDIPYWPSIDELQWFAETNRDGLFRKISQDDYEAQRWVWYCNVSARATWPEDE